MKLNWGTCQKADSQASSLEILNRYVSGEAQESVCSLRASKEYYVSASLENSALDHEATPRGFGSTLD